MESKGGTYKEVWKEDGVKIKVSGLSYNMDASLSKYQGMYLFKDTIIGGVETHYYLEMPYKITESNMYVEGNKAEWHINSNENQKVYARCKIPQSKIDFRLISSLTVLLIGIVILIKVIIKKK